MPNDDSSNQTNKGIGNNVLDSDLPDADSEIVTSSQADIKRDILPTDIRDHLQSSNGVQLWETDPATLKDYSNNVFVEGYIDYIAKTIAGANWSVDDDKAKSFLNNADPRYSFSEMREAIARDLASTGNAFIAINRENGQVAEALVLDPETVFIVEDDLGFITGYVRARPGRNNIQANDIDKDRIIHLHLGADSSRDYGKGYVEKSLDIIDNLDQLLQEDINNLRAGSINGVLGVDGEGVNSQDLKRIIKQMTEKDKGKRHKVSAVEADVSFENINDNFSEMQILDRYRNHIENLGGIFDISPQTVGFESGGDGGIGQGNKAKQERINSQESVREIMEQIEDKLNRELIEPEFDTEFRFEVESEDEKEKVEHIANLGKAAQQLREANIGYRVEEGKLIIEDAEFDPDGMTDMDNVEQEEVTTKPDKLDECVQSVIEDNPDLSESEAFAICNGQLDIDKDSVKEVPDKYLDERDKAFFVPTDEAAEKAQKALDWEEEYDDEIDAFGGEGEGLRRAQQIVDHNSSDEALDIEYWNEINNFHSRHHAQGNQELDSEFESEPWKDNGYISHLAWGGDAAFEQAQRVMELVEEVDGEDSEEESDVCKDLSERKAELLDVTGRETLEEALNYVEEENDTRVDAIRQCQTILSGTLSQSTYYDWLDEAGLR